MVSFNAICEDFSGTLAVQRDAAGSKKLLSANEHIFQSFQNEKAVRKYKPSKQHRSRRKLV
jgi:hypothetical protein